MLCEVFFIIKCVFFHFFLINCSWSTCTCQHVCTESKLMHKMWCNCVMCYTVSYVVYWFSCTNPHTNTCRHAENRRKSPTHPRKGRDTEMERWCVNGCSCLSHPGLFFSSLTQQSISSVLEGLVLDSSWHVLPSLRARDERTCCAECSNIAHTHNFSYLWNRKRKRKWKSDRSGGSD